jgi:hypothetical protein
MMYLYSGAPMHFLSGVDKKAFSLLKALLRKGAARTADELGRAIRHAIPKFTQQHCANYFTAAGYEPE